MKNKKITYELIVHRGEKRIRVIFDNDNELNERIRKVEGRLWSKTLKSWHIPATEENCRKCGLGGAKPLPGNEIATIKPASESFSAKQVNRIPALTDKLKISIENAAVLRLLKQRLELKRYSASTIKTYYNEFSAFVQTLGKTCADSLSEEGLKDYLHYCSTKLKLSENTGDSRRNAFELY